MPDTGILVVTGTGGMGRVCARRLAAGRTVALFEIDGARLDAFARELEASGHTVIAQQGDVADPAQVAGFAERLTREGRVTALLHTAGISGAMADADRILDVNLMGTAHVMDTFADVLAPGGAAVMIASMGRISIPLSAELDRAIARAPTPDLKTLVQGIRRFAPVEAYCVAKRANYLRVAAMAQAWGRRGLRINSISPGIIATPMADLEARHVPAMATMRKVAAISRIGQPEDIAAAAAFLLGPEASFITGTDLAVDGGLIAALTFGDEKAF